jgi:hypothetical protein
MGDLAVDSRLERSSGRYTAQVWTVGELAGLAHDVSSAPPAPSGVRH